MKPSNFLAWNEKILKMAEDTSLHILDRIDAYLELSERNDRDPVLRGQYRMKARDLIRSEFNQARAKRNG